MDTKIRQNLISEAKKRIAADDPSHDFTHTQRVLENALNIAKKEGGDLEIIIPAALFHDLITYPKNDPREKISKVEQAILGTSPHGLKPTFLEAKIVQDADLLEATGAIAIMRTFASSGKMNRPFYSPEDPFAQKRELDDLAYAVDLFYTRLLNADERMDTLAAKKIAKRRIKFLQQFLAEFQEELQGK